MIVTVLWRVAGSPVVAYAMDFDDVSIGEWYTEAVRWAAAEGLLTGTSSTTLEPAGQTSRAQIAMIMMRFSERYLEH